MSFSTTLLPTPADCDAVLAYATNELRVLNNQAANLGYRRDNTTASATELQTELTALNAEISFLTPLIPTMPASDYRTRRENELRKAIDRRDELSSRQEAKGPVALLIRELELEQVQTQLAATNAFVTAVTAHRATL